MSSARKFKKKKKKRSSFAVVDLLEWNVKGVLYMMKEKTFTKRERETEKDIPPYMAGFWLATASTGKAD